MPQAPATSALQHSAPQPSSTSPQKVNFTARYKQRTHRDVDELEDFWKLPREDFENCDPIQWWAGRRAQFPGLSRYVRDIFSIPGGLPVTLSQYLSLNTCLILQDLPLPLSVFSQVDVTRYPYVVQAYSLTPSKL
jgi:hypothetical protein